MLQLALKFTKHAREQMIERGISVNEVEEAIRMGVKTIQDGKILAAFRYYKVVYKKEGEDCIIITVTLR